MNQNRIFWDCKIFIFKILFYYFFFYFIIMFFCILFHFIFQIYLIGWLITILAWFGQGSLEYLNETWLSYLISSIEWLRLGFLINTSLHWMKPKSIESSALLTHSHHMRSLHEEHRYSLLVKKIVFRFYVVS